MRRQTLKQSSEPKILPANWTQNLTMKNIKSTVSLVSNKGEIRHDSIFMRTCATLLSGIPALNNNVYTIAGRKYLPKPSRLCKLLPIAMTPRSEASLLIRCDTPTFFFIIYNQQPRQLPWNAGSHVVRYTWLSRILNVDESKHLLSTFVLCPSQKCKYVFMHYWVLREWRSQLRRILIDSRM